MIMSTRSGITAAPESCGEGSRSRYLFSNSLISHCNSVSFLAAKSSPYTTRWTTLSFARVPAPITALPLLFRAAPRASGHQHPCCCISAGHSTQVSLCRTVEYALKIVTNKSFRGALLLTRRVATSDISALMASKGRMATKSPSPALPPSDAAVLEPRTWTDTRALIVTLLISVHRPRMDGCPVFWQHSLLSKISQTPTLANHPSWFMRASRKSLPSNRWPHVSPSTVSGSVSSVAVSSVSARCCLTSTALSSSSQWSSTTT